MRCKLWNLFAGTVSISDIFDYFENWKIPCYFPSPIFHSTPPCHGLNLFYPGALKTQSPQSIYYFGAAHEQFPHEARPVVFDHHYNRAFIYRQITGGIPVAGFAEGIRKTIFSPDPVA
jgi:hypothetical protein